MDNQKISILRRVHGSVARLSSYSGCTHIQKKVQAMLGTGHTYAFLAVPVGKSPSFLEKMAIVRVYDIHPTYYMIGLYPTDRNNARGRTYSYQVSRNLTDSRQEIDAESFLRLVRPAVEALCLIRVRRLGPLDSHSMVQFFLEVVEAGEEGASNMQTYHGLKSSSVMFPNLMRPVTLTFSFPTIVDAANFQREVTHTFEFSSTEPVKENKRYVVTVSVHSTSTSPIREMKETAKNYMGLMTRS